VVPPAVILDTHTEAQSSIRTIAGNKPWQHGLQRIISGVFLIDLFK